MYFYSIPYFIIFINMKIMEIKVDVKFNIGDKVYVRNRNNGRMDTDGEGIIEGYIINKTKKSCKAYYLVEKFI